MSVLLRHPPVCGPSGVADGDIPRELVHPEHLVDLSDLPDTLPDVNLLPLEDCDSCAVVPPVLHPSEPLDYRGGRLLRTDKTYDGAHSDSSHLDFKRGDIFFLVYSTRVSSIFYQKILHFS